MEEKNIFQIHDQTQLNQKKSENHKQKHVKTFRRHKSNNRNQNKKERRRRRRKKKKEKKRKGEKQKKQTR